MKEKESGRNSQNDIEAEEKFEEEKRREKSIHREHRKRMREKIRKIGFEGLEPHEQLEVILYNPIVQGNTNDIAHRLIERFGSIYNIFTADEKELTEVDGIGSRTAVYLKSLLDITGAVQRFEIENEYRNVLGNAEKASKYAVSLFHGKVVETLYIISLNSFKKVISNDSISIENASQVTTTVAFIAKIALSRHASFIMLAHNHPGGTLNPSPDDLQMQRAVYEGLNTLSVKLEYNFIVAQGRARCIFDRNNMIGI